VVGGDGAQGEEMEGGGGNEVRSKLGWGGNFYRGERALDWPGIETVRSVVDVAA
jgi:hypothetical protein